MWLNPIVKRDVRVQSRSMKICWGVFAYELILAFVFFCRNDGDRAGEQIFDKQHLQRPGVALSGACGYTAYHSWYCGTGQNRIFHIGGKGTADF